MPPVPGECWGTAGWVQQPRNRARVGGIKNAPSRYILGFCLLRRCAETFQRFSPSLVRQHHHHHIPLFLLFPHPHPHPLSNTTQAAGTQRSPIAWSPAASKKLPSARLLKPQVQASTGKHNSGMEMKTPLYIQREPKGSSGTESEVGSIGGGGGGSILHPAGLLNYKSVFYPIFIPPSS